MFLFKNWCFIFLFPFLLSNQLIQSKQFKYSSLLSNEEINTFLTKYNLTDLTDFYENVSSFHSLLIEMTTKYFFFDPNMVDYSDNPELQLEYNNALALAHFYLGEIEYYGLINKKQNLLGGLGYYTIASYFGNPESFYKLYILFETNIISIILNSKEYSNLFQDESSILYLIKNTKFYNYFLFTDDYERKAIANQFLYTSSLSNYQSATATLAYKYYKGYGVQHSCQNALNYYKSTSQEIAKDIYKRKRPSYYEKPSLEQYEYIGNKFSSDTFEIQEIIDYFKVEAENGHVNYIQQLGQRYLFGQGVPQDFKQAFYYFNIGMTKNDSTSIYFLGEMYLNGWGISKNYENAYNLFKEAISLNNSKAYNSLGYMYYYGYFVEKNVKRAYDYFKTSFTKAEENDAYFNQASLLLEGSGKIQTDYSTAYKYLNFIAAKGHTFGTYMFAMMNEYKLGSLINTCEITVEFFRTVAERNSFSKRKSDYALKAYKRKSHKQAALIYLELAEEGHEISQVNAAILFDKYDIFMDKNFNKFLAFKYFRMASHSKNIFATLKLADYYYYGFGNSTSDYKKAYDLYIKVVESGSETSFYTSHAYFSLGIMNSFGEGVPKNYTKALRFYNLSTNYEPNSYYPALAMKYYIYYLNDELYEMMMEKLTIFSSNFAPFSPLFCSVVGFVLFYIFFLISLKLQK